MTFDFVSGDGLRRAKGRFLLALPFYLSKNYIACKLQPIDSDILFLRFYHRDIGFNSGGFFTHGLFF
jgi:hypothetical protein